MTFSTERNANSKLLRNVIKRNVCRINVAIKQVDRYDVIRSAMLREAVLSVVFFIITQHADIFRNTGPRSKAVYADTENTYERLANSIYPEIESNVVDLFCCWLVRVS